jgi:hypothetical protein
MIARLRGGRHLSIREQMEIADKLERVCASLRDCAADLEGELRARYGENVHPAMQRKFERDMSTVAEARALAGHPVEDERKALETAARCLA